MKHKARKMTLRDYVCQENKEEDNLLTLWIA